MDIELLSKMVKELILDHDKVALPGLGSFVAETVPSSFSDKGYTINPPYRKLSFRPYAEDDSLISELYASVNNVDKELASAAVEDFVSGLKEVLETRKNVVFPGLGRLRATKENNFFFVADEDLDIYPEGFGLVSVSLKTHVETKEEVSAAVSELKSVFLDHAVEEEPVNEDDMVVPDTREDTDDASKAADAGFLPGQDGAATGEPESALAVRTVDEPEKYRENGDKPDGKKRCKTRHIVLIVFVSLILLTVLYMVTARIFPDFMDRILYDGEQLDVLRQRTGDFHVTKFNSNFARF